jgi:hypothetical protein
MAHDKALVSSGLCRQGCNQEVGQVADVDLKKHESDFILIVLQEYQETPYVARKHSARYGISGAIEDMMDEIDTEVDIRQVSDFLQRRAHDERRHEVGDCEGGFLILDKVPDRLLADFLADTVADKGVLGLDGVVSGELAWRC